MKEIIFVILDTNVWVAGINFDCSFCRKILEAGGIAIQPEEKKNSVENQSNVNPYYLISREIVIEIIDILRRYFDFADAEAYL